MKSEEKTIKNVSVARGFPDLHPPTFWPDMKLHWAILAYGFSLCYLSGQVGFTKITQGDLAEDRSASFASSWADYDNDGLIDLYFFTVDTDQSSWPYSDGIGRNRLFRNLGDGEFERVVSADNPIVNEPAAADAGVWADYDNDGDLDLFVANWENPSQDQLYRNEGNGEFINTTADSLPVDFAHGIDASWVDFNSDGWVDIFVANGSAGFSEPDHMYMNLGNGKFQRIDSLISSTAIHTQSGAWADFDNDGDQDLFATTERFSSDPAEPNIFYRNDGNNLYSRLTGSEIGSFIDQGRRTTGSAWGDFNNDGYLDLATSTSNSDRFGVVDNYVYINHEGGRFNEFIALNDHGGVACVWGDFDNDGFLDLFMTSNFSSPNTNLYYHNNGSGGFVRVTEGDLVNDFGNSYSASAGDFNNDGFLDLFVSNGALWGSERNGLYQNNGNDNHWIQLKLAGVVSNRSAIGARIRLKASIGGVELWQVREISGGSTYQSQNDMRVHFGLGDATIIDTIQIKWPSGIVQELHDIPVDQILSVQEEILQIHSAVILSWPILAEDHVLESSESVDGPWIEFPAQTQAVNGKITTSVVIEEAIRFFRLRMPNDSE